MEFEWSEGKRLAALDARRLDFLDGRRMFGGRNICAVPSPRGAKNGGSASGNSATI
jgi:hypothetical protein